MITIYHNPRCSKSRETLALVQEVAERDGQPLNVIDYLKTPPDLAALKDLRAQLGGDVRAMLRDNEEEYASLGLAGADDAALLAAIAAHSRLLQRPIVSYQGRAIIGRPPENVLALFGKNN
ncbi:arsenate reductase (glutaredoxin) [Undibacterium terreum]|uniref:arsenate reductase (glutaredoxin) n=1 Tax=Undibacterium terreum TaxID=1224302 RepID=UPI001667857F|nr:arsenate reductase (glutaredoxin) [Undibacterium terreum]